MSIEVAPYTGAWIETTLRHYSIVTISVAPYTGAWIETIASSGIYSGMLVAPYTGAWIETSTPRVGLSQAISRSLHGSVD